MANLGIPNTCTGKRHCVLIRTLPTRAPGCGGGDAVASMTVTTLWQRPHDDGELHDDDGGLQVWPVWELLQVWWSYGGGGSQLVTVPEAKVIPEAMVLEGRTIHMNVCSMHLVYPYV